MWRHQTIGLKQVTHLANTLKRLVMVSLVFPECCPHPAVGAKCELHHRGWPSGAVENQSWLVQTPAGRQRSLFKRDSEGFVIGDIVFDFFFAKSQSMVVSWREKKTPTAIISGFCVVEDVFRVQQWLWWTLKRRPAGCLRCVVLTWVTCAGHWSRSQPQPRPSHCPLCARWVPWRTASTPPVVTCGHASIFVLLNHPRLTSY